MPRDLESGRGADAASHVCSGAPLHVARRSELRQTLASLESPFPLREGMQPHTGRWHGVHLVDCRRRAAPGGFTALGGGLWQLCSLGVTDAHMG